MSLNNRNKESITQEIDSLKQTKLHRILRDEGHDDIDDTIKALNEEIEGLDFDFGDFDL